MRTVPRMTRYLSGMAAALFIAGCGGGGGGGGSSSAGGSTPVPPPNTPATLSVSSNTIAATASTAQSAPTVGFSVQITTTVSTSTEFYVNGSYTKHGIASISEDSTAGNFTIVFQSPAALGVGTYQDTITLEACYQSACSQQVTGSPQVIAVTYTVTQGAASLTSLNPATVQAAVAFTLTVDGSGFLSSSVIVFNGTPVSTTYLSPTQITAAISAAAINQPGTYGVAVAPSLAEAGTSLSNQLELTVYGLPSITSLTPNSTVAGLPGFSLSVLGSNFPQGAIVLFGGTQLPTTWVDSGNLTASVTSAQVLNPGVIPVTVATSASPSAVVSSPVSFTVQPLPAPASNSVDPSIVTVGGPAFTLTVLGQGFVPSAAVQWNGAALQTTYVSELELRAQVPATDIGSIGTAAITVQNSTGAGGTTAPLTLKIAAAAPDAVSLQITPAHAGAVNFNSLSFPSASKWSVNVGGIPSYAIIADGKVVVTVTGNSNFQLIALDQATGATDWGPITISGQSIAYEGGKVFVLGALVGGSRTIQSYDIESGTLDWSAPINPAVSQGITALNGLIYTDDGSGSNTFDALSEGDGTIAWSVTGLDGLLGMPAATDTGVYRSFPCSTYGFQPLTGAQIFSTNTGCDGGGGTIPVVANGLVYSPMGSDSRQGAILDQTTGAVVGSFAATTGEPAFSATAGYFLQSGTLNALTGTDNNTVLWSFTGDGGLTTAPIVVNQAVIIESSSGNVYALNAATGQQLWTVDAGGPPQPLNPNSGLAAGDGLLIVPAGNQVVAYTLSTNP